MSYVSSKLPIGTAILSPKNMEFRYDLGPVLRRPICLFSADELPRHAPM